MKDDLEASNNVPSIQHLIRLQGEENFEQKLGLISILLASIEIKIQVVIS